MYSNNKQGNELRLSPEFLDSWVSGQLENWPLAAKNHAALKDSQHKSLVFNGLKVEAIFNPARAVSTAANLSKSAIASRPCFLCKANRPAEQGIIDILPGYELLVNPFPILPGHLTIAAIGHSPQILLAGNRLNGNDFNSDRLADLYNLACRLPGYCIFYNGASCGASAPDHFHFQAVRCSDLKIFDAPDSTAAQYAFSFSVSSPGELKSRMAEICADLARLPENQGEAEPRFNLFASLSNGDGQSTDSERHNVVEIRLFPRRRHRPAIYGTGDGQMLISPGALDVAGVIVTVRQADFDRLDAPILQEIFGEVCIETN